MYEPEGPASYARFMSEVVSHAGIHVDLTIFGCISCPPLSRTKHLFYLGHRK